MLYLTGIMDSTDYLLALDSSGIRWTTPVGRAWTQSFSDSRATPTVDGKRVYASSGRGDLACVDALNGQLIWSRKASEEFGGTFGGWGISESLLVDQANVYFSPGGDQTMTIALDKYSGAVNWKSESLGDNPAYVSPVMVNHEGQAMLVNVSASFIYALDPANGDILWKFRHLDVNAERATAVWPDAPQIKCVTPLYYQGEIYVTGGYDHGGMKISVPDPGEEASLVWYDSTLDVHLGGVVLLDNYIYGSNWLNNRDGNWCCIDWETGEVLYEEHWECKGSLIFADGHLYLYEERRGNVALVKPGPDGFRVISSFRVPEGSGPHWAHPSIHDGKLYIRHGNALMVYDIAAG